jgi:peptide/nickel transport system permease protein
MARLIIRRVLSAAALLFGLASIVFLLAHIAPGDPAARMLSPTIPASAAEEVRRQFGLDEPLARQYFDWLANALSGNLGVSFSHFRPVTAVILDVLPNTAILAFAAIALELVIGISLGTLAARAPHSRLDRVISAAGVVAYTLPAFWTGFMLLALFSYWLGIFPSSQMHSVEYADLTLRGKFVDFFSHLALPALTIAIPGAAGVARYFRDSLTGVRSSEYVAFAESLGIAKRRVFLFYELPNAAAPVVTFIGLEIGTLLAGALVTETIFAWPGMGRLAVQAISSRDYPLIMGCTLFAGAVVIMGNFLADALYRILDPRTRIAA